MAERNSRYMSFWMQNFNELIFDHVDSKIGQVKEKQNVRRL